MKARGNNRKLSLAVATGMLMTLIVPAAASLAADEPKIAFLNPSSFALAGERGYIVSDAATDTGPGCCAASDGVYRLSAWVADAPADASVFFTVVQGALDFELSAVSATGRPPADTWEASWDIPPEVLNGPATITAYVVVNNEPVAQETVDVTIMRVEPAIDLAYPESGGTFGTFAPLASSLPETGGATRKKPLSTVDALYTATPDMTFVRTFYTTSPPGTDPRWEVCGTEVIGSSSNNRAGNGVRCTIANPADAQSITAVAALANDSPNDYDDRFNESGDAVRVVPYVQQPTEVALDALSEQRVEKDAASDRFFCSTTVTATVTDQLGRTIPGANVDAEAVGPTDSLKFNNSSVLGGNVAPDRGTHSTENAFDCTGRAEVPPPNASPGRQGEHAVFGSPDHKHIESPAGGTSDRGTLGIRLHSTAPGVTQYTVWADEVDDGCAANDDRFTFGEPAAAGSIGWATNPDTPVLRAPLALVPCSSGPDPSPDPTESPDGPADRTVGIKASSRRVAAGTKVRLTGRIRSADAGCISGQHVTLQARRPGRSFRALATGLSRTTGRYRFGVTVSKTRQYRAVLDATDTCLGARSRTIRVRVIK